MVIWLINTGSKMETTLNLDDQILSKAKAQAAKDGITLTKFVEDALTVKLLKPSSNKTGYKYRPVIVGGDRPPAVDPADRSALYDYFDDLDKK